MRRILSYTGLIPALTLFVSQSALATTFTLPAPSTLAMGTLIADQTNTTATTEQPKKKKRRLFSSGGFENESPGDMNFFQLKPSVINERYYASGRAERTQKTSPTLPPGAPIPDEDNYVMPEPKASSTDVDSSASNAELHSALLDSNLGQSMKLWSEETDDKHQVNLTLQVTDCSEALIKRLKELNAQVLSTGTSMNIAIPARRIQAVSELKASKSNYAQSTCWSTVNTICLRSLKPSA